MSCGLRTELVLDSSNAEYEMRSLREDLTRSRDQMRDLKDALEWALIVVEEYVPDIYNNTEDMKKMNYARSLLDRPMP